MISIACLRSVLVFLGGKSLDHCNRNSRTNCDSLRWDTLRTNWLIRGNRIEFLRTMFGAFKWMFSTIQMDLINQLIQLCAFVLRRKQHSNWFRLATRKRYLFVQQIFRNHFSEWHNWIVVIPKRLLDVCWCWCECTSKIYFLFYL